MGYRLISFEKGVGDVAPVTPEPKKPRFKLVAPPPAAYSANEEGKGDMQALPASVQAKDALKSFGSGVVQGATALAGTVGDVQDLAGQGVAYLAGKAGVSRETQEGIRKAASQAPSPFTMGMRAPRSQEIQAKVEEITGPSYEPQTTAGRYANTVGQFAPNVIAGPGGMARKAAMTVIPAVASEAAGDLTEGSKYQPLAKAGAAVAATLATGGKPKPSKLIAKNAPTQEAVKTATDKLYSTLRDAGIRYDSNTFDRMAVDLTSKLNREGFRAAQAPMTADALQMLGEKVGQSLDFNDFESIRKVASQITREVSATATDKKAARMVMEALDDFSVKAPLATNGSVAPKQVAALQKQARELAQRNILARDIDDMFSKAETYQSGFESGLKNQFSNYLRSNKAKSLPFEVRKAFAEVAKGGPVRNALTTLGRFGIDLSSKGNIAALIPFGAAGATYAATSDPYSAAAVAALGTGAKFTARKMVQGAAERAKNVTLAGREAQKAGSSAVAARKARTIGTTAMSAQEANAAPAQWPAGAFMQDAQGRFYDRNGKALPAR